MQAESSGWDNTQHTQVVAKCPTQSLGFAGRLAKTDQGIREPSFGSDSTGDTSVLLGGRGFDLSVFQQFLDDAVHDLPSLFNVGHFTASEDDGNLYLVLVLQEAFGLFDLKVDVVRTGLGTQTDFLGLGVVKSLALLLLLVVFVFAVIHDSANGRSLVGSDFNQIETGFTCLTHRLVGGDDPQLTTVISNHTDGRNSNLLVHTSLIAIDLSTPFSRCDSPSSTIPHGSNNEDGERVTTP